MSNPRRNRPKALLSAFGAVRTAASALALALCAQTASGLPEDREQPLIVEADDGIYEPQRGVSVLTGSVRVDQGTLHMQAQKVTLFNADERLARIVAEGQANEPATLRQRVRAGEPIVTARAGRIDYAVAEQRIELSGDALVRRGERELSGDVIRFDLTDGSVDARSDQPGGVRMKWQPETGRSAD